MSVRAQARVAQPVPDPEVGLVSASSPHLPLRVVLATGCAKQDAKGNITNAPCCAVYFKTVNGTKYALLATSKPITSFKTSYHQYMKSVASVKGWLTNWNHSHGFNYRSFYLLTSGGYNNYSEAEMLEMMGMYAYGSNDMANWSKEVAAATGWHCDFYGKSTP
jgi:hypothetical protein